jgi:hypothetical protein
VLSDVTFSSNHSFFVKVSEFRLGSSNMETKSETDFRYSDAEINVGKIFARILKKGRGNIETEKGYTYSI